MNHTILKSVERIQESLKETNFFRGGDFNNYSGEYFCDCSSLVSSILKIENPQLFLLINPNEQVFRSCDYFNYAKDRNLFVNHVSDVLLGDIICWKKSRIPRSGDSGHMAIVISLPECSGNEMYKVRVFDATKTPHSLDTRVGPGVGSGELFLVTNLLGEMIGIRWSEESKKMKRTPVLAIRF